MIKVELLDHMGDDLAVVNAARVSFDKESNWEIVDVNSGEDKDGPYVSIDKHLSKADAKLISYLAKHQHFTPFSHCYAKFRIKVPIFVRSQLFKHKVGLTENEVSRRYVDSEPEFYIPDVWRKRAEDKKQGSSDDVLDVDTYGMKKFYDGITDVYNDMLKAGIAPEMARMVLPQSMMTEFIWSGSIAAFARVYKQRTSPHAQSETRTVAYAIGNELRELFPVSWKALTSES